MASHSQSSRIHRYSSFFPSHKMNPDNDTAKLTKRMQQKVAEFLRRAGDAGLSIRVFEARRTLARQKWLYAQGRTRKGKIVTWTMQSNHLDGEAVDIVFVVNGQPSWSGDWNTLIRIGKECGLNNLAPKEQCHFEDNGQPFTPYTMPEQATKQELPDWAKPVEEQAKAKGITTDLSTPVGAMPLYHLLAVIQKFVK